MDGVAQFAQIFHPLGKNFVDDLRVHIANFFRGENFEGRRIQFDGETLLGSRGFFKRAIRDFSGVEEKNGRAGKFSEKALVDTFDFDAVFL